MIRVLIFLAIVFALGLGFAWLADRPGDMVLTFGGYQYQVSLMVAAVTVVAIVASVMILWWFVKSIWNSPYAVSRYFRVRRRDRGYQALSTGMVAAGAGDAALARKMNKQASKLIRAESEPLLALLDAQASLLEGDHAAAREKLERMLDNPEMLLLGLRGLYLEAERLGERSAARHYAGRAADIAPQLAWAAESTLEEKTAQGDWNGALKLVEAQKSLLPGDKDAAIRRRVVLLTAKAQDLIDTDPAASRAAALEANRLKPGFAPAAVIAAKVLFKQNDTRKGAKILEAAWRADPHPEVADLYVHARPGDATLDRLRRAQKLQSQKQNHVESALIVARAAFDAKDYALAREAAETAVRLDPQERAYLLLADIEEAETGDQGRIRYYLSKAVRSPRDPAWVADGFVSDRWAPVSPVTGRLDAFEWRVPMERIAPVIDQDEPELPALAAPPVAVVEPAPPAVVEPEALPEPQPVPMPVIEPAPAASEDVSPTPVAANGKSAHASVAGPIEDKPIDSDPEAIRLPDDPGVEPSDKEKAQGRFRLF